MSFALLVALAPAPAAANGQSAHIWITREAVELLPEGELRSLLEREDLQSALVGGTQFPDGGYAVGHGYGELAHWEPFQDAYLAWIREEHPAPYADDAARHVAFLMGMASHGMADQTFDALFVERARYHDAPHGWAQNGNFDADSDVLLTAAVGPVPLPAAWVPYDELVDLVAAHTDQPVDRDTLERANRALRAAVLAMESVAHNDTLVAEKHELWPWGAAHLLDADVPGSPPVEAVVVAAYWLDVWDRLQGEASVEGLILDTWPAPNADGHVRVSAQPESWVSVAFARGLKVAAVGPENFVWADAGGRAVPFTVQLYYRDDSHVVHLKPSVDLSEGDFAVRVLPGLGFTDGRVLGEAFTLSFSTRPPAAREEETGDLPPEPDRCGCAAGAWAPSWAVFALVSVLLRRRR